MIQNPESEQKPTPAPRGMTAMGVFLFFGAAMASLAGETLVWRGTWLDRIWRLNPRAYAELLPLGRVAGILFLLLAAALALAGVGWLQRKVWGWWMAVAMIAAQVVGGMVHLFMDRIAEGAVGVGVAGLLLVYLLRPSVIEQFRRTVI